ncbi:Leucine Rich Repeat [Seminavis robusta]|uniref:Leucine Rich Repeat n=1 Tax=Seminavis robusta TaxID=568900 RepID=A0A9N8HWB3_9STRA|nr:Leucine Rich Repeat [Seminavis robusta]|eukprot:Sro1626_g286890.1 Leucine Rich Repeat (860) ;mRNA; f:14340-16919
MNDETQNNINDESVVHVDPPVAEDKDGETEDPNVSKSRDADMCNRATRRDPSGKHERGTTSHEIGLLERLQSQEPTLQFLPTKTKPQHQKKQDGDPQGKCAMAEQVTSHGVVTKELLASPLPPSKADAVEPWHDMFEAWAAVEEDEEAQPGAFRQLPGAPPVMMMRQRQPTDDISYSVSQPPSLLLEEHQQMPMPQETSTLDHEESAQHRRQRQHHRQPDSVNSNDMLVEAHLVEEQDETRQGELVTAEPMPTIRTVTAKEFLRSPNGKRFLVGGILCALSVAGIIVGVLVGVVFPKETSATQPPTLAPTSFVEDLLPAYTQQALNDTDSPQARAYQWYLEDLEYQEKSQEEDVSSFVPLQRFVLATIYYALHGDDWVQNTNWLDHTTSTCNWYSSFFGSICSTGPQVRRRQLGGGQAHLFRHLQNEEQPRNYYNRLSLYQNNLNGTLPPEISLLTYLDVINLHDQSISGRIPSEAGLLEYITLFQLFKNHIQSTVPSELGLLPRVKQLNLAFNELTGTIPSELGQLHGSLESLSLSNNFIHSVLPTELGLLTSCTAMYFYNTPNLTGPLPSELGAMDALRELHLNGANWTGTLPSELGSLATLTDVYLNNNRHLEGTIPSSLGQLTELSKLSLHNTNLSGSVPPELCSLLAAGTLTSLSVDCDKVSCPCDCDCSQTTGDPPFEYDANTSDTNGGNESGTVADPMNSPNGSPKEDEWDGELIELPDIFPQSEVETGLSGDSNATHQPDFGIFGGSGGGEVVTNPPPATLAPTQNLAETSSPAGITGELVTRPELSMATPPPRTDPPTTVPSEPSPPPGAGELVSSPPVAPSMISEPERPPELLPIIPIAATSPSSMIGG